MGFGRRLVVVPLKKMGRVLRNPLMREYNEDEETSSRLAIFLRFALSRLIAILHFGSQE